MIEESIVGLQCSALMLICHVCADMYLCTKLSPIPGLSYSSPTVSSSSTVHVVWHRAVPLILRLKPVFHISFQHRFWGSSNSDKCKYLNASIQFRLAMQLYIIFNAIFIYLMWHVRVQIFTYQNRFQTNGNYTEIGSDFRSLKSLCQCKWWMSYLLLLELIGFGV